MNLRGRRGVVFGVANKDSLAWSIARRCVVEGARVAVTYQSKGNARRIAPLLEQSGVEMAVQCDVERPCELEATFQRLATAWNGIDFVVHAIGFSDPAELRGRYLDTSEANFVRTMLTSVYSFTRICRLAEPLLRPGASLLTLSYLGGAKVVPNYNAMGLAKAGLECSVRYLAHDLGELGVRVNALSAGPIRTLSSTRVRQFGDGLRYARDAAPLRRNVGQDDVAKSAVYLLSDLSSGVTGETHFVDGGLNTIAISERALAQDGSQGAVPARAEPFQYPHPSDRKIPACAAVPARSRLTHAIDTTRRP